MDLHFQRPAIICPTFHAIFQKYLKPVGYSLHKYVQEVLPPNVGLLLLKIYVYRNLTFMYNNLHYSPDCTDCFLYENRNELERATRGKLSWESGFKNRDKTEFRFYNKIVIQRSAKCLVTPANVVTKTGSKHKPQTTTNKHK